MATNGTTLSAARRDKYIMTRAVQSHGLRAVSSFSSADLGKIVKEVLENLHAAIIEKKGEKLGDGWVRYFSLKTTGPDEFGPHHVSFIFDIPAAGTYKASLKAVTGPDQGIIQMFQHDSPLGDPVDLYSMEPKISKPMLLGNVDMTEGNNVVYFKLIGQNPDSKGLNMKMVEVIFERIH